MFGIYVVVIIVIVTIYRVYKNHMEELHKAELLQKRHQHLLQSQAVIDEKRQDLGTKVRHWFMIQPCSRCHEFKMTLLEISPNGRSVHYQCLNCKKKMHAPAGTPDAPQITELQNELSTLIDKFQEEAFQFRRDQFRLDPFGRNRAKYLGEGGRANIEDSLPRPEPTSGRVFARKVSEALFEDILPRPEPVCFESPAAPLPYEQTTRTAIPEAIRSEVWRRDSGQCVQCGSKQNLQFDHIIPVSLGGATSVANLQLLCQPCNGSKSNKI